MDALELQAALVKLDPATTVTPIGSTVKIVPHHRIAFTVDLDESDVTLQNAGQAEEKPCGGSSEQATASRKLSSNCSASLTVSGHQSHQNAQQIGVSKCGMAEVR
ncbi:hypothetical protein KM043_013433 [Ampulex compressa]|nr:hypothetical protein KM043_013433 [Ampulex compressa]